MHLAGRLTPEELWAHMTQLEEQVRALAQLLPLYGVADWTGLRLLGDRGWHNDALTEVGLAHGDRNSTGPVAGVQVTMRDGESAVRNLRIAEHDWSGEVQLRALEHRLAATPTTSVDITIDGQPERFTRWNDDARWYAAARRDDHSVVIEARDITTAHIGLVRVRDIEPYLAGRRAHLRALRGET